MRAAHPEPSGPRIEALFALVERGLAGMAEANAGFSVRRRGASVLVIDTGRAGGSFELVADVAAGTVSFASPKIGHGGGAHAYVLRDGGAHWASTQDGHFLLELLTRDLIHAVPGGLKGCPNF